MTLQQIGAVGYAVTAALIWLLGIVVGASAFGQALWGNRIYPGHTHRDWPVIAFRLGMLLVWLGIGFMVMAKVNA